MRPRNLKNRYQNEVRLIKLGPMRAVLLAACLPPLLAACASAPIEAVYDCDGDRTVEVAYQGDSAVVSAGGERRTLPLAISASGARYASGPFEIWDKGGQARVSGFPGGPYDGCKAR